MSEIILYDLPSKGHCAAWSPNPWKTRLVLNYKNIPYKTEWVEYPDIAPKLKSFGLSPNADGSPYSIPTICDTNGKYTMDSKKIVAELESQYPEPSLHLDSPILAKVEAAVAQVLTPLRPVMMPPIPTNLLRETSVQYFERTREARFGMPLPQFGKEQGGDDAWKRAEPAFQEVGKLLKAEGGPFLMGKTVSYADMVIVAALHFMKRVDVAIYERATGIEPALADVYNASQEWLKRDDH